MNMGNILQLLRWGFRGFFRFTEIL